MRLAAMVMLCGACVRAPLDARAIMLRHVSRDGPNHSHMERLAALAPAFSRAEGAELDVVLPAVLLHDAAKEDGAGTPFERFCTHHLQAAAIARATLGREGLDPSRVERVARAIEQHMGPLGENPEFQAPRFMTGFCTRDFPTPSSAEARVVFDLDMLDLMTVEGVVKVVTLRQRNAEFEREPLEASALSGRDSAWKSVVDAGQVLTTKTGRACGEAVQRQTRAFLDQVDFASAQTVEAFHAVATAWRASHPLPECLRP